MGDGIRSSRRDLSVPTVTRNFLGRKRKDPSNQDEAQVYLVGGGIASLAAAAFMIRDGDISGHSITFLKNSRAWAEAWTGPAHQRQDMSSEAVG